MTRRKPLSVRDKIPAKNADEILPPGQVATPERIQPFSEALLKTLLPDRGPSKKIKLTPRRLAQVLNEIANCGTYYMACAAVGVSLSQFHRIRDQFEIFEELVQEAKENYEELICRTVHNRAIEGWDEPVFQKGKVVGYIRRHSDRMLEMQAKKWVPAYRDRGTVDVNVTGGVLVVHAPAQTRDEYLEERRQKQLPGSDNG